MRNILFMIITLLAQFAQARGNEGGGGGNLFYLLVPGAKSLAIRLLDEVTSEKIELNLMLKDSVKRAYAKKRSCYIEQLTASEFRIESTTSQLFAKRGGKLITVDAFTSEIDKKTTFSTFDRLKNAEQPMITALLLHEIGHLCGYGDSENEEAELDEIANAIMETSSRNNAQLKKNSLQKEDRFLEKMQNESGMTRLMFAAYLENYELVKRLVKEGTDVNAENEGKETALFFAIISKNDSSDILEFLLNAGANIDKTNATNITPIIAAITFNKYSKLQTLLKKKPDLESKINFDDIDQGLTPLMLAALKGDYRAFAILMTAGANPLATSASGWSVLSWAFMGGDVQIQRTLERMNIKQINKNSTSSVFEKSDLWEAMWGDRFIPSLENEVRKNCQRRGYKRCEVNSKCEKFMRKEGVTYPSSSGRLAPRSEAVDVPFLKCTARAVGDNNF